MIYEDQGDMEKSLQFELIAAHLNPSDTEEWVRLAEMSLEQDNIKQAIFCYTIGNKNVFLALFDKMLYNRFMISVLTILGCCSLKYIYSLYSVIPEVSIWAPYIFTFISNFVYILS